MARGVNKVILIGNLGEEPNCRTINTGSLVCNFSMVTNEVRRNPATNTLTEYAEWHRVVLWGRLAENAQKFLHKGSPVYIEGKLRSHSYTDKQGIKRYMTEVVADDMTFLGSRPQGQDAGRDYQSQGAHAGSPYQAQESEPYGGSAPAYGQDQAYGGGRIYGTQNAGTQGFGTAPAAAPSPYESAAPAPAKAPSYGAPAESGSYDGTSRDFGPSPYGSRGMPAQNPYDKVPVQQQSPSSAAPQSSFAPVEPSTQDEGEDEIPF